MRGVLLYLFIIAFLTSGAQDKVFLLNGAIKQGKVLEISKYDITLEGPTETKNIDRSEIAIVEFQNGSIEVFNQPKEDIIYNPISAKARPDAKALSLHKPHYVSLNTLSLYNADISVFYEYVPKSKKFGAGIMGAYNFNPYSTIPNLFITQLHNAKKNYDIGVTFNFYPRKFESKTTMYFGAMLKYMNFNFHSTKTDSVISGTTKGVIVSYIPDSGSQLATIFTMGTHTKFNDNFYIKTLVGFGAYRLKGNYRTEFLKQLNDDPTQPYTEMNYLPKAYIGINVGFNL
ncbi:MAG: hypothetical protein K0S32_3094 [Bacteroidetes bacterium]|jgi:sRNA-binding regulator protein Hfq|nr:hypothetical protein [Bacteroidota bacterium]